jgi:hypothetical protein
MFDRERRELTEAIGDLKREIAELRIEREARDKELGLTKDVVRLQKEIEELKITKSRITEEHAREKREVEHLVGLQKKRQEFEVAKASQEATLAVREENLKAEKDRFAKDMKFMQGRMEEEVKALREMYAEVLKRLPTVTVDLEKSVKFGGNGSRAHEEVDA